jgi:hypothetical protein
LFGKWVTLRGGQFAVFRSIGWRGSVLFQARNSPENRPIRKIRVHSFALPYLRKSHASSSQEAQFIPTDSEEEAK